MLYFFSYILTTMAPKHKCKAPSRAQKRRGTAKSKRAQLPPKLPSSTRQLLGHNEMGPSLQDVMTMLNSIAAWLDEHNVQLHEMAMSREALQVPEAPHAAESNRLSDTQTMDVFDSIEDAARRQVAERLRTTTACPATTDEESGDELPHASHPRRKLVSGRLRTADNTAVSHVT